MNAVDNPILTPESKGRVKVCTREDDSGSLSVLYADGLNLCRF